jgi:hypothetical protein
MAYRWPMTNASGVLQEALEIAMAYLEYTGQAALNSIRGNWLDGRRFSNGEVQRQKNSGSPASTS